MKLYKKLLLAAALVVVVGGCYAAYRVHQVQASYYAMAGEVTVMDKFESSLRRPHSSNLRCPAAKRTTIGFMLGIK